jgi:nucleotide-binding universal stress UspA family protein
MTQPTTPATRSIDARTPGHPGPIIVALKLTEGGEGALAAGWWLAGASHAKLHLLSVTDDASADHLAPGLPPLPPEHHLPQPDPTRRLRERAARAGCYDAVDKVDVIEGPVSAVVARTANDRQARVVVVGTGRHGPVARVIYGERALEIVGAATSPVLVVPRTTRLPFTRAIVAVDFSVTAMRAAAAAVEMLAPGGRLTLAHVKTTLPPEDSPHGRGTDACELRTREMLARFADALPAPPGIDVETALLYGAVSDTIVTLANDLDADLVCCGRTRHSLAERIMVGSVSSALVRRSAAAVLVVPERAADGTDDAAWTSVRG